MVLHQKYMSIAKIEIVILFISCKFPTKVRKVSFISKFLLPLHDNQGVPRVDITVSIWWK